MFEVPDGTLVAVPMINSEATVEPVPASPVQVAVSLAATFSNPRVTYETLQVGRHVVWEPLQCGDGFVAPTSSNTTMVKVYL